MRDQLKIVKMAEQILNTSRITGLNLNIPKNTICVNTLRTNNDSSYFHGLSVSLYKPLLLALTVLMFQCAVYTQLNDI